MFGGSNASRREIAMFAAAALIALGTAEAAARAVEKWWDPGKFHLLPERTYEAFFFHTRDASKPAKLPVYDAVLGWRNAYPAVDEDGVGVKEDGVNADGWRVEPLHAGRQRIVLIGDSFVFGYGLLERNTISRNL